VSGGQRQMRRDERGSTEVAAFGFQLTNGIPGGSGNIGDCLAMILTEKQHLNFSRSRRVIVIIGMNRGGKAEESNH